MSDDAFLTALQEITGTGLGLGELINAASNLSAAGKPELARQLYRVWIGFNPEHPQLCVAHFNASGLDTQLGDADAAQRALEAAIALNPDFMPAYINLGGVLERKGEPDRAVELWRTAVNRPVAVTGQGVGYAVTALKQIARLLADHHQNAVAEAALRQCVEINPGQRDVIEQFLALRLAQCKWPVLAPVEGSDRQALMRGVHPLSMAVYTDDPLLHLASAERYIRQSVAPPPADGAWDRRHASIDLKGRRLRLGYVSSDLRDHAIGYLMAELFELHDRAKVEVFAYYCGSAPSGALNARIRAAVEHWTDIREMSDDQAAQRIADDGIDILVDVNGHTRDSRTAVFARRPAPIQVNWLGYPGSMGSPFHQYLIADDWIIPPDSEVYYTEKVLRLPCYQPNDRRRAIAEPRPSRQDAGLPEDAVVFCCFNGAHKINRFTFERWMRILQRTPGSVLWLLESAPETHERLRAAAAQAGVDGARIVFAPRMANAHHLARYPLADLFLDTSPYGAHTTASDALWMGVPVLTLAGRSFASRVCGSLVRAAGLPELVCDTPEAYVERAAELGADRAAIAALKARLEAGRSSCLLFDTERLVRSLEQLLFRMCEDHREGRLPRPDLDNLEAYLEIGVEHDHEAVEMLAIPDYRGFYQAGLGRRHLNRPMRPDTRLWTPELIAEIDRAPFADEAEVERPAAPPRRRAAG